MAPAPGDVSIALAETDAAIAACFPVLHELRPLLVESEFVARVRHQMSQGYRLAHLAHAGTITTVAGFRVHDILATGRTMYVDDLVTAAATRSQGHGRAMLAWLVDCARAEACESFSLDSGTQRKDAHAFYLRERMRITSFHFHRQL